MDPIEKAKQGMGGLERAANNLPGVAGYRDKEMRRDADKAVRTTLAERLEEQRRRITDLQHQMLTRGGLTWMDSAERVVGRLQLLIDRIRTASYGYAGFFDLQKVREDQLDALAAFDKSLYDNLPKLDEAVGGLQSAVTANEGIAEALQALADLLAQMNDTFGRRAEAMKEA